MEAVRDRGGSIPSTGSQVGLTLYPARDERKLRTAQGYVGVGRTPVTGALSEERKGRPDQRLPRHAARSNRRVDAREPAERRVDRHQRNVSRRHERNRILAIDLRDGVNFRR